jgi:hypothetical protein
MKHLSSKLLLNASFIKHLLGQYSHMAPRPGLWVNKASIFLGLLKGKFYGKYLAWHLKLDVGRRHKYSEIYKLYDEHDDVKFIKLIDLGGLDT